LLFDEHHEFARDEFVLRLHIVVQFLAQTHSGCGVL
jgi:hypothetical protein